MSEMNVIRVTGIGRIKLNPDLTTISMTLEGGCKEYDETLQKSSDDTEILKNMLEKLGFDRSEVKTIYFHVSKKEKRVCVADGEYEQKLLGYSYQHEMKVSFDIDNQRLGRILYTLAHAKQITPQFSVSYSVKDSETAKNLLLENAIKDAKDKAETMARAAGVALGKIKNIDYSWGAINFESTRLGGDAFVCCDDEMEEFDVDASYNMDITPTDIETSDNVTLIWEIMS